MELGLGSHSICLHYRLMIKSMVEVISDDKLKLAGAPRKNRTTISTFGLFWG